MYSGFRTKLPRLLVLMVIMVGMVVSLTACGGGGKVKRISLTCSNGAEVNISMDTTGNYQIGVEDNVAKFNTGEAASGELITSDEANQLLGEHFGDGTYSEMTINGGSAFGYEVSGTVVHVIPVDEFTYLCVKGESNNAVYTVETVMTIESVKAGAASVDDFAQQVSQYGVGDVDIDVDAPDTNSSSNVDETSSVDNTGEASTESTTSNP